jgi:acetylornithine deacetylase/succinyl-diaminopimelate desuccinylase family protein
MKNMSRILEIVENRREELIDFACDLVATPSENPPGDERNVAEVIINKIRKLGLGVPQVLSRVEHRPNLILEIKRNRPGPVLMFNAHMDTKPVGDQKKWRTNPFEPTIMDGKLYGLGSADMKGALAAEVFAAAILQESDLEWGGGLTLVFTADEEAGGAYGAKFVAEQDKVKADIGLIGEPVGINREWEYLGLISRGETCFRTKVYGTQMHSSIADLVPSTNASLKMAEVLVRMSKELKITHDPHPYCPQGVTMGIGVMVKGGVNYGILPGYAEFATDVRLLPGMTVESVQRDIESFIAKLREEDPSLEIEVEIEPPPLGYIAPVIVSEDEPFVAHLRKAAESVLGTCPPLGAFPAWTDARYFDGIAGIKTIPSFGPGLLTVTHAPNEHISTNSIVDACKIYALSASLYLTAQDVKLKV